MTAIMEINEQENRKSQKTRTKLKTFLENCIKKHLCQNGLRVILKMNIHFNDITCFKIFYLKHSKKLRFSSKKVCLP